MQYGHLLGHMLTLGAKRRRSNDIVDSTLGIDINLDEQARQVEYAKFQPPLAQTIPDAAQSAVVGTFPPQVRN
jgi:hypothetical protein